MNETFEDIFVQYTDDKEHSVKKCPCCGSTTIAKTLYFNFILCGVCHLYWKIIPYKKKGEGESK